MTIVVLKLRTSCIAVTCQGPSRCFQPLALPQVSVLKLSQMEFLPFQADAEIGHVLEVPLAMYHVAKKTGLSTAFTDCSLLALDVGMDKQGVFALSEEGTRASPGLR